MNVKDNFLKGFVKENPVFVFLLGMCPTLAVTSTLETAVGMGLLVIFVLFFSNIVVSLLKSLIPDEIRIPGYIVIIATFVTIVKMLTDAFAPALAESLGVFIPLIVVNCIILGRAESFASKHNVFDSMIDALGMGLGFTYAVAVIGIIREFLATGAIAYGVYLPLPAEGNLLKLFESDFGAKVFSMPGGAFITLGLILAFINYTNNIKQAKIKAELEKKKAEAIAKAKAAKAAKAKAEAMEGGTA